MTDFPEIIKDGDIELRSVKPTFEFAKEVFDIVDRNREHLGRWLPWVDKTKTPEDQYDGLSHVYKNERAYFIFYNEKLVGSVSFVKRKEENKSLEIGYWLDAGAGGCGIMARAVKLLENAAFGNGDDWEVIRIFCDVLNEKSQNVAKRAGYVYEGTMRHKYPYNDGRVGDTMVFSKLKSEWKKDA
jgi:RimJ/RimL family protein N-acetyltransferase